MLSESFHVKPDLSTADMAMLKNLGLVFNGNLIPFANMFEIARLLWLGSFVVVETEDGAILLGEIRGKQISNWDSFLTTQ
jgi:hypothetical protein